MPNAAVSRIHPLSAELANQIAAGEVVERPASVLKELLENSLDAGADRIEVEVERGGSALVRVRDNGAGIHPDDLGLALHPHATSKISSHDDLERVASLGFRGEALASIASVSRLSLTSRSVDGEQAWRVENGSMPVAAAHPVGTTVDVRDLFYNTPARRKFLRTESTEFHHLEQVFRRLALSRFDVAMTLRHNRRDLMRLRAVAAGDLQRVTDVTGAAFSRAALPVAFEAGGLRLWGWVAPASAARPQADVQYFYLNRRLVRDRLIGNALRQAYRDRLPEGRHPAYVLYLELDPAEVDVNVHPTKHEVRFHESRRVHDFLFRAVQEATVPAQVELAAAAFPEPPMPGPAAFPRPALRARGSAPSRPAVAEAAAGYRALADGLTPASRRQQKRRIATVLFGRFVLVETPDGPYLVDGAGARRESIGRRLREAYRAERPQPQPLLVPELLAVNAAQAKVVEEHAQALAGYGFDLSVAGDHQLMLRQMPAPLRGSEPQATARCLLNLFIESLPTAEEVADSLAQCAAGAPLDGAVAQTLLDGFESLAGQPWARALDAAALIDWFSSP